MIYLWQLPQHLLALLLLRMYKAVETTKYKSATVYRIKDIKWGISLGQYIILSTLHGQITVKHEYGHSLQSLIFGPLYLLIIGVPSIVMNILTRIKLLHADRYYKRWPESWADKLGEVER